MDEFIVETKKDKIFLLRVLRESQVRLVLRMHVLDRKDGSASDKEEAEKITIVAEIGSIDKLITDLTTNLQGKPLPKVLDYLALQSSQRRPKDDPQERGP